MLLKVKYKLFTSIESSNSNLRIAMDLQAQGVAISRIEVAKYIKQMASKKNKKKQKV